MRILYVEDNPGDLKLLQCEFAETAPLIEIEWAATYGEAVAKLSLLSPENPYYDLVLTDMNLPDGNGISLLSMLREHNLPIALIVITGLGDEDSAVSALKAGAIDYMVKRDNYLKYLPGTIETALQRYQNERTSKSKPLHVLYCDKNIHDINSTIKHCSIYAPFINFDTVNTAKDVLQLFGFPGNKDNTSGRHYDVLLIDYQLPEMSAIELLKELRDVQKLDVPIVIISNERSQEIAVQSIRVGADDYIAKNPGYLYRLPIVLENVFNRIQIERERAVLKASEEHFRMLIENSTDFILAVKPDGIINYCSPSIEKILGYKPEEFYGKTPEEFIHPDDLSDVIASLTGVMNTKGIAFGPIVLRVKHKSGSWRYLEVFGKSPGNEHSQSSIIMNSRDITERKEAEEALRRSEERYRMLAENANDMIWNWEISESGNRISYVSPSVERLIGYTVEEAKNLPIETLHPPASALKVLENIQKVIDAAKSGKRDEPDILELEYICKDGSIIWAESISSGVFDDTGRFKGILGVSRDITKRKQTEEALLTSQIQLSEAMDLAQVVYWEVDSDRMFLFNDSFYSFLRTTAEAEGGYRMALKDYVERFVHPEEADIVFQSVEQTEKTHLSSQVEHRMIRRDGEIRHVIVKTRVIKDDAGRITHISGTNQDITERKKMEVALQESEIKYRGLVENSLVGVFIIQDDTFQFVNKRFCEIHGYTYEEIVNKAKSNDFVYNDEKKTVEESIKRVTIAGPTEQDFRIVRKDGKLINGKAFVSLISYKGRPAVAGTMIDTTHERSLENQLRQAQKMEALGTLAGGIAHDFNNILTVLIGYGELLKMGKGEPLRTTYIDAMLSASSKATNLTKGLLAFSRRQPISLTSVNINEIMKGTEKLLKRLLTEDITFKTKLSEEEIIVLADTVQIDQILFNLAVNARDAMPMGGSLTLETKVVRLDSSFAKVRGLGGPGRYALLSVSDTGIGMDEVTREHIFEPFFTTKEVGKGTGLGLSTVYGIVKQHNGYISVYSEKNIGTTFNIYLPITNVKVIEERDLPLPVGGTEIILLAEDNKDVRDLMRKILCNYGYTVIEAEDGEEAIGLYNVHNGIALLILDSVMPKKNGRQVYDEISQIHPHIKVIFTSGYTRDVVLNKGIEDKIFDFLSKPVLPDVLIRKVREVLDR